MRNIALCAAYLLLSLIGMTLVKMGGRPPVSGIQILHFEVSIKTVIGMFFYGLSFLLYTFLVSRMTISIAMPALAAVSSCAIVVIGVIVFGEKLNAGQVAGIAIVIAGTFVMGIFSK